jgi:hypothetical protein
MDLVKKFISPVDWSARQVESCGIAAAMLRSRRSDSDEEAQRRPAESEVPGTEINSPVIKQKRKNKPASLILSMALTLPLKEFNPFPVRPVKEEILVAIR